MSFPIPSNRVHLLRVLSAKADISQVKAAAIWNAMLQLARDGIRTNGSFSFPGLGKLQYVKRKARRGWNNVKGKRINIPAKDTLIFRVSKLIKNAVLIPPRPLSISASQEKKVKPSAVRKHPQSNKNTSRKSGAALSGMSVPMSSSKSRGTTSRILSQQATVSTGKSHRQRTRLGKSTD